MSSWRNRRIGLAFWRVSGEEINYRRFFDINDLVGLRMENPSVFAETHELIRKFLADGLISGLRLDHPDGLLNPSEYIMRLQRLCAASQCEGAEPIPRSRQTALNSAFTAFSPSRHRPASPLRCTCWWRRYWKPASACPTIGRLMGPSAMTSPRRSTTSSLITAMSAFSHSCMNA